jgi:hypothetical protein
VDIIPGCRIHQLPLLPIAAPRLPLGQWTPLTLRQKHEWFITMVAILALLECVTAWKALSHANAKGKGIKSKGWVGNQVFILAEEEKKK